MSGIAGKIEQARREKAEQEQKNIKIPPVKPLKPKDAPLPVPAQKSLAPPLPPPREYTPKPQPAQYEQPPPRHISTSPTPSSHTKLRYFLLIAGFIFISLLSAFLLVVTSTSTNQNHRVGKQPHLSKGKLNLTLDEGEFYWDFSVSNALQTWQQVPSQGAIPGIYAPKGSIHKFEVSCTTVDGILLTKGVGYDVLAFDARLRYLGNGDLGLLFFANNIQILQSTCTLYVTIKS